MRRLIFAAVTLSATLALAQDAPTTPIPRTERKPEAPAINQPIPPIERNGGHAPDKPPFVIGVWYQPHNSFALWKARGINTLVGYEGEGNTVPLNDWQTEAEQNELFMIRQPRPNAAEDLNEPYLLAWLVGDEPDIHNLDAAPIKAGYAQMKKDAPNIPVFLNVSGGNVLFKKTPRIMYEQYFEGADWVGNDFYPVTGWNQPTWIPRVGQAIDQCREMSKGKPQFAFIEAANQKLAWLPPDARGVTPAELRAEIWTSVIHGVKGIVYFPQQMNPFKFEAMPTGVSVEMMRQNRLLETLGPVLASPANPRDLKVVVNPPLEAAWRKKDGKAYAIVLNLANERQGAQPLRLTGFAAGTAKDLTVDGRTLPATENGLVDDFEPYGVRIYELDVKP